jgi:hypothetical protein
VIGKGATDRRYSSGSRSASACSIRSRSRWSFECSVGDVLAARAACPRNRVSGSDSNRSCQRRQSSLYLPTGPTNDRTTAGRNKGQWQLASWMGEPDQYAATRARRITRRPRWLKPQSLTANRTEVVLALGRSRRNDHIMFLHQNPTLDDNINSSNFTAARPAQPLVKTRRATKVRSRVRWRKRSR